MYTARIFLLLLTLAVCTEVITAMISAIVTIAQGILRGEQVSSRASGKRYYRFQGIPYASTPSGPFRFQDTREPPSWSTWLNVLENIIDCPQGTSWSQEDCLYLNVYTPQLPSSKNHTSKPVMVWIHGGGFTEGSISDLELGPDYLVDEDIVLVTINYRLGVLGFLSLEGTDVSPNAGFKDQTAALRWVKNNIAKFGGNPESVTIFGHGAGGASVSFHLLSPMSRGLFHRAISSSGSALNPWTIATNTRDRAFRLSRILGFKGNDSQELVDYLRTLPADELIAAQQKVLSAEERRAGQLYPFVGTVEKSVSDGNDVFLPDTPNNLLQSGNFAKVPYLAGDCSAEFREAAAALNKSASNWETLSKDFERYVPVELGLKEGSEKSREVAEKIKKFYFGTKDLSVHTVEQFCNMESDIMFVKGVYKTSMDIMRQSSAPVYNYLFSYDGKLGRSRIHGSTTPMYGPNHGDDLTYLFYAVTEPSLANSTEMITLRRMVSIWTNFAKTGNPAAGLNINWAANTDANTHCLNINATLSITDGFVRTRMKFWEDIYNLYNKT